MGTKENRRRGEFTVFQHGSHFVGQLKFSKPLKILGSFEGEMSGSDQLEIGPQAKIKAHIEAAYVTVYGNVAGNITASEKVELKQGATLTGNIRSPKLEIDEGVIFDGQCEMKQEPVNTGAKKAS